MRIQGQPCIIILYLGLIEATADFISRQSFVDHFRISQIQMIHNFYKLFQRFRQPGVVQFLFKYTGDSLSSVVMSWVQSSGWIHGEYFVVHGPV